MVAYWRTNKQEPVDQQKSLIDKKTEALLALYSYISQMEKTERSLENFEASVEPEYREKMAELLAKSRRFIARALSLIDRIDAIDISPKISSPIRVELHRMFADVRVLVGQGENVSALVERGPARPTRTT